MNNVSLIGRITKDLEIKQAGQTSKCDFTIAVNRTFAKEGQQQADFINITVFGKQAENLVKYQSKGSLISVVGSLNIDQYQDKEGNNRSFTKVLANNIGYLESGKKGTNQSQTLEPQGFQAIDNDDIPF